MISPSRLVGVYSIKRGALLSRAKKTFEPVDFNLFTPASINIAAVLLIEANYVNNRESLIPIGFQELHDLRDYVRCPFDL